MLKKLLTILYLLFVGIVNGQPVIKASTGIGVSSMINLGVQFREKNDQFGISVGSFPIDAKTISLITHYSLFYGRKSRHTGLSEYFIRAGFGYILIDNLGNTEKNLFGKLGFGSQVNFSKNMGVEFEYGVSRRIKQYYRYNDQNNLSISHYSFPRWIVMDISIIMVFRIVN